MNDDGPGCSDGSVRFAASLDDVRGANDLHALLIHPSDAVLAVVVGALFAVATSVAYSVLGMLLGMTASAPLRNVLRAPCLRRKLIAQLLAGSSTLRLVLPLLLCDSHSERRRQARRSLRGGG